MARDFGNKEVKPTPKKVKVAAVFGLMIDPTDSREYTQVPVEVNELNSWQQVQIGAGKMRVIE